MESDSEERVTVERLERAIRFVLEGRARYPTRAGCLIIHGGQPKGTSCLDQQRRAADPNERMTDDYRARQLAGDYLCANCVLAAALDQDGAERTDD